MKIHVKDEIWNKFRNIVKDNNAEKALEKLLLSYINGELVNIKDIATRLKTHPFVIRYAKILEASVDYREFGIISLLLEKESREEAFKFLKNNRAKLESLLGISEKDNELIVWLPKIATWFGPFGGSVVEGEPQKYIEPNILVSAVNEKAKIKNPYFVQFIPIKILPSWISALRELIEEGYINTTTLYGFKPKKTSIIFKNKKMALKLCDIIEKMIQEEIK